MASPIVGTVLLIGITFSSFGLLIAFAATNHYEKESCESAGATHDLYDSTDCPSDEQKRAEYAMKCRCEPPTREDGSLCEPISVPDRFGVAWRCGIKPILRGE